MISYFTIEFPIGRIELPLIEFPAMTIPSRVEAPQARVGQPIRVEVIAPHQFHVQCTLTYYNAYDGTNQRLLHTD